MRLRFNQIQTKSISAKLKEIKWPMILKLKDCMWMFKVKKIEFIWGRNDAEEALGEEVVDVEQPASWRICQIAKWRHYPSDIKLKLFLVVFTNIKQYIFWFITKKVTGCWCFKWLNEG